MRNASGGKFSLGSAFGRKAERQPSYSGNDFGQQPNSPSGTAHYGGAGGGVSGVGGAGGGGGGNGHISDDPGSPGLKEGGPGATFDGLGKKLGKTFAHNSLLPSLGNKDQRALQDLITAEKGVLTATERFANESAKASTSLPTYGLQEGPDLHDILTQSSVLLNHLTASFNVFAERQTSLRGSLKRIREREEALSDLRSRRRATGNKAEAAERKLAKMGPENKQLPSQTELLESLRGQMRGMDTEIVNEESRIGDYKRQSIKEALSFKFAGLEELGEKLCIIGELGKLVIEEVPLDETPPGYGRAPYNGFAKTESAVDEAGRCLSQVKFNAVNSDIKPSHLPKTTHTIGRDHLPATETLAAAEEYGHGAPPGMGSPSGAGYQNGAHPPYPAAKDLPSGNRAGFALDDNPYGGLDARHQSDNNAYREYGGVRDNGSAAGSSANANGPGQVVWQGPTEEALARQNGSGERSSQEYGKERIATMYGGIGAAALGPIVDDVPAVPSQAPQHQRNGAQVESGQDYEYEQQREMDRQNQEEQAGQDGAGTGHTDLPNPYDLSAHPAAETTGKTLPLNIRRDRSASPNPQTLPEGAYDYASEQGHGSALVPPPSFAQLGLGAGRQSPSIGEGTEGFRTPLESPAMAPSSSGQIGDVGAVAVGSGISTVPGVPVIALNPETDTDHRLLSPSARSSPLPPPPGLMDPAQRGPSPHPYPALNVTTDVSTPPLGSAQDNHAQMTSPNSAYPASPYTPTISTGIGGKISAGAFRNAGPRRSDTGPGPGSTVGVVGDDVVAGGEGSRRLPVPPGPPPPGQIGWQDEKKRLEEEMKRNEAVSRADAPPEYGQESLR